MRIYLVRHGETVWNKESRTQGWSDIELNATGRRHAAAIALALKDAPLRAVYASSLSRALATAQAIAAWHGLAVVADPDLRELHQGELDGKTFEELRRDHASLLKDWGKNPARLRMPGGESMADLQQRAWGAIERIKAAHPEGAVAVVCHNLTIVTILCRVLGLDLNDFRLVRQDVAAINIVEFGERFGTGILRMNDTAHVTAGERLATALACPCEDCRFVPAPIAEDDLARIIAAAGGAGIPEGDYRVLVVADDEQRRRLGSAWRAAAAAVGDEAERAAALESAPVVLALLGKTGVTREGRLGAALQNMRIAAHTLAYGTAWLDGKVCDDPAIATVLAVAPPWRLAALLAVGLVAQA